MRRYKLNENRICKYIQIPKELFTNNLYKGLSNEAKVLYGHLLDRMELSRKNKWANDKEEIYVIFTRKEIEKMLSISNKTCTKIFKELKESMLIEEVRQGLNKPNIIYIGHLEECNGGVDLKCKKYTSRDEEYSLSRDENITVQEKYNLHGNNTNINNTNLNKTYYTYKEEETLSGYGLDCDILECYKKYISKDVSDFEFDILAKLERTYNKELTIKAIKTSCEYNKKNLGYIRALVEDWCNKALNDTNLVDDYITNWKNDNKKVKEARERKIAVQANQEYSNFDSY